MTATPVRHIGDRCQMMAGRGVVTIAVDGNTTRIHLATEDARELARQILADTTPTTPGESTP